MLHAQVAPPDVVEVAIVGFTHQGIHGLGFFVAGLVQSVFDEGIHGSGYVQGIGEGNGGFEVAQLLYLRATRQLAKPIGNKDGGGDFVLEKVVSVWYNYGDSGAGVLTFTQGVVADLDIADVSNGVVVAGGEYADVEAKGAGAGLGLGHGEEN